MLGDLGAEPQVVLNIHEGSSTKSTQQLASQVEFPKRSNGYCLISERNARPRQSTRELSLLICYAPRYKCIRLLSKRHLVGYFVVIRT
jgi:hypothetical protein